MNIQTQLQNRLVERFSPTHLALRNDSHLHGNPPEAGTHFTVSMVAPQFEGLNAVKRHQAVYAEVGDFLEGPVHALALKLYGPNDSRPEQIPPAPACGGGDGRL